CPVDAAEFKRVDSLIMYLEQDKWPEAASLVQAVAASLASDLRESTPPLTLRIVPGVAFAEDPGNERSFGESRGAALAAGVAALKRGDPPEKPSGVLKLARSLRTAGIDPARPWLNAST